MQSKRLLAATVALGGLLAVSALAQQTAPPAPATGTPMPGTEVNRPVSLFNGSLQKSHDEWRASKIIGQTVYNEQGQSMGSVDELLVDDSGKITQAVLSVGGFLGIGAKLVAIPFDQLKFTQNANAATEPATGMPAPGGAGGGAGGGKETSDTAATSTAPPGAPSGMSGSARGPGPTTTYFSVVMPGGSKSSLTAMGDFHYAS